MPRSSRRWRLLEDEATAQLYGRCAALQQEALAAARRLRALLLQLRAMHEARLASAATRKGSFAAAADRTTLDAQPLEVVAELLQSVVAGYQSLGAAAAPRPVPAPAPAVDSSGSGSSSSGAAAAGAAAAAPGPAAGPASVSAAVFRAKTAHWLQALRRSRLVLAALTGRVVAAVLAQCNRVTEQNHGQAALACVFRLASLYNDLLALSAKERLRVATVCRNTCPALLHPLRRLSLTRLLQLLAQARADDTCRAFVSALLHGFHGVSCPDRGGLDPASPERTDSSSLEVYRALTRHLTPPCAAALPPVERAAAAAAAPAPVIPGPGPGPAAARLDGAPLRRLLGSEEAQVTALLAIAAHACPQMLGPRAVRTSRSTGLAKATRAAEEKVQQFSAAVLWSEVGSRAEHELLWWGPAPMGSAAPAACSQLRRWLHQLLLADAVPEEMVPAMQSLMDAMCCHVTSTSWDQLFRLTLVNGRLSQPCKPVSNDMHKGTETGRLYGDVLAALVSLSNACEATTEWAAGAPLAELPLVEQIPVLHRLDHSVHTARLWAAATGRALVAAWRVSLFTLVTQWDVGACLAQLSNLRLASHTDMKTAGSEHVVVCARMRAKLVSEVQENIDKLKKVPDDSIQGMAAVCRTVSLANLHMVFPEPSYWRQNRDMPRYASSYVEQYLERVLRPILGAISSLSLPVQQTVGGMVIRIMCEAWLDHIYMHRIKFTEWGAFQLLADFGAVPTWLTERAQLSPDLRRSLSASEALRQCEGVGRLLLRSPGEHIPMSVPTKSRGRVAGAAEDTVSPAEEEAMPAEMYVPNQEQWLELRAHRGRKLCSASLCCS